MRNHRSRCAPGGIVLSRVVAAAVLGSSTLAGTGCARYVSVRPRDPVSALGAQVSIETVRRVAATEGSVDSVLFRLHVRAPRDTGVLIVVRPPVGAAIRVVTASGETSRPLTSTLRLVNRRAQDQQPDELPLRTSRGEDSLASRALPAGVLLVTPGQEDVSIIAPIRRDGADFGIRAYWYTTRLAAGENAQSISLTDRTWRADSSQIYVAKVRNMPFMIVGGMGMVLCALFLLATTR